MHFSRLFIQSKCAAICFNRKKSFSWKGTNWDSYNTESKHNLQPRVNCDAQLTLGIVQSTSFERRTSEGQIGKKKFVQFEQKSILDQDLGFSEECGLHTVSKQIKYKLCFRRRMSGVQIGNRKEPVGAIDIISTCVTFQHLSYVSTLALRFNTCAFQHLRVVGQVFHW